MARCVSSQPTPRELGQESINPRDMDDLILRVLSGEADDADGERLETWRAEARENALQYQRWRRLWELSALGGPVISDAPAPCASELIRRGEMLRKSESPPTLRGPWSEHDEAAGVAEEGEEAAGVPAGRNRAMRWAAALAALLIPAAVAVGLARGGGEAPGAGGGPTTADTSAPTMQVATAANEVTTINLSDGSGIRVGPGSRVQITEGTDRITIHLEGRAFFGVPPDQSRRFVVTTPLGEAAVLGTRFEVRSEDEEFRVLVVEGAVHVLAGQSEAELRAGEMGRSIQGSIPTTSEVDDVAGELDWLGNALFFQATPLATALREVEERFEVMIHLEAPTLADQTVTASFVDQEAKEVLAVLCAIVGAQCRWDMGDEGPPLVEIGLPADPAAEIDLPAMEPDAGGYP